MTRKRILMFITSRRSGKTDLLCILVAIFMICIPNLDQLCWSLYNSTSALFARTVVKWLIDLGYKHKVRAASSGDDCHVIFTESADDIRRTDYMGSQNPNVSLYFFFIFFFVCIYLTSSFREGWQKKKHNNNNRKKGIIFFVFYIMFPLLCAVFSSCILAVSCSDVLYANESDYGHMHLIVAGNDANIYFNDKPDVYGQLHWMISVSDCTCLGTVEVQKKAQLDYMIFSGYLFSFSIYVNDGQFHPETRRHCGLSVDLIQQRTTLAFNQLGAPAPSETVAVDNSQPYTDRVEGFALWKGMHDFYRSSHVQAHRNEILSHDKGSGFFFTQGTVFVRPCTLFPWFVPFLLDSYQQDHYLFQFTPELIESEVHGLTYFNDEEATLFNSILDDMKQKGIVKDKHMFNLADNTGATFYMRAFHFEAVFIPYRYGEEFMALLEPFAQTMLSPYIYVPFVFQLMWDKNEWSHTKHGNDTIYATKESLLISTIRGACSAATAEAALTTNTNDQLAQNVYFFASWCGSIFTIEYIKDKFKHYVLYHFYRAVFFLILSICMCIFMICNRKRIVRWCARSYLCLCACFKCRFTKVKGYMRMASKQHQDDDMSQMSNLPGEGFVHDDDILDEDIVLAATTDTK